MKDAPFTTPPIVAKQADSGALRRMLFGHAASDAYYEALDAAGRRRKAIPTTYRNGRLAFQADVSIRPDDATIFYELTCD